MEIKLIQDKEGKTCIGILENADFLLHLRGLIKSFALGKIKNFKATAESFNEENIIKEDITQPIYDYLHILGKVIKNSLNVVENKISIEQGYLIKLLNENNSFLIIKLHLIIQTLLWDYIETKLPKLPKQYENWNFIQIIDLADAFGEIPSQIISYFYSLNEVRNYIAHKPLAFEFRNIKSKYKNILYKKSGVLFKIQNEASTDDDIFDDWVNSFLISIIILGYIIGANEIKN